MKILLDECIDRRLTKQLLEHEIKTVPQAGWAGIKDGELLRLAAGEFDVFITIDGSLPFQQNLRVLDLVILILQAPSNRLADLQVLVPKILKTKEYKIAKKTDSGGLEKTLTKRV